ncbi:pimeloyl-[acyl-carrier protein] methyl ester esterase [Sulfurimicrobium lacus]|uniref:Pimeloyl-[acyl-carrier protein] methyl ester esterase n=1 Tax=Sulfurimicrobium lacus TaxID=2715678 RepID=A0A6F8V6Y0_9PROT|nr:pimeloyl-ACP methyl ester esterase BioH [Sulfurimicrobium lacus]BCB25414.1 pimeloyl-[acyl-carrier protein] methyl ester esterase [Sulfurimicrobium lacus]
MSLHVDVRGTGPDLVLLHGWGMHSGIWGGVHDELARDFRVHAVDLPGYGASPPCQPYDLPQLVQAVASALPSRAGVIGWSLGGLVAQRLGSIHPQQVTRLMLVGATPCFVQRPDWPCGIEADVLQNFARDLEHDYAATLMRFLSLQVRNGENVRTVLKYLREALFAHGMPGAEVLRAGLNILLENDLRTEAGRLALPLSIVHGERDMLVPADAARWLAAQVPDARLNIIPGCAHAPFLSHPKVFMQEAREFFS